MWFVLEVVTWLHQITIEQVGLYLFILHGVLLVLLSICFLFGNPKNPRTRSHIEVLQNMYLASILTIFAFGLMW